jgi:hypothetical protein
MRTSRPRALTPAASRKRRKPPNGQLGSGNREFRCRRRAEPPSRKGSEASGRLRDRVSSERGEGLNSKDNICEQARASLCDRLDY